MRYLVTGGAGFIGSHLVHHLVPAGHDVVVFDDLSTGRRENLTAVTDRIRFLVGSVTDPEMCRRAMEGVDCVLHQAALTSVERSVREPLAAHAVNATGTVTVLLAAADAGVRRVVFAGSTSAYGNLADLPNCEDDLTQPLSPYAASKLAAELLPGVSSDLWARAGRAAVFQHLRAAPGPELAICRGDPALHHGRTTR